MDLTTMAEKLTLKECGNGLRTTSRTASPAPIHADDEKYAALLQDQENKWFHQEGGVFGLDDTYMEKNRHREEPRNNGPVGNGSTATNGYSLSERQSLSLSERKRRSDSASEGAERQKPRSGRRLFEEDEGENDHDNDANEEIGDVWIERKVEQEEDIVEEAENGGEQVRLVVRPAFFGINHNVSSQIQSFEHMSTLCYSLVALFRATGVTRGGGGPFSSPRPPFYSPLFSLFFTVN